MQIMVTLKDPDTMPDAVNDAMNRLAKPDGVSAEEWETICDDRAERIRDAIGTAFMEYSEYLRVVFDVDDDMNVTAQVLRNGK